MKQWQKRLPNRFLSGAARTGVTPFPRRASYREGNMDFVAHNWFYILVLALFVGMHLTGFGCGHRRSRIHKTGAGRHTGTETGTPGVARERR